MSDFIEIPKSAKRDYDILPEGIYNVRVVGGSVLESKFTGPTGDNDKQIRLDLSAYGKSYSLWITVPLHWWKQGAPKEERMAVMIGGEQIARMFEIHNLERRLNPDLLVGKEYTFTVRHSTTGEKTYPQIRKIEPPTLMNDAPMQPTASNQSDDTPF